MDSEHLEQELSDQEKLLLLFGYLGPLALLSLVASRREIVKWHAKQGLVVWAGMIALVPVLKLLQYILDRFFFDIFGELYLAALWLTALGVLIAMLFAVIRGLEGERFKLPLAGELADRL